MFAGGGTGGHLYPAIAVAQKIRELQPESEILFVGTKTKIESRVVPKMSFSFKSIWISGFSRQMNMSNLLFPFKVFVSMIQSLWISIKFKPQVAVGTGAYVSGPAIWGATFMGAKGVLLEQNSFPGITNRLLEKKVRKIFLSFEESKKYFREKNKLEVTGNPVRIDIVLSDKSDAKSKSNLDVSKKTLLVVGGSLGAKTINEAIKNNLSELLKLNIQILWQTGEKYFDDYSQFESNDVKVVKYLDNISIAYSAADLLIARAGATTIAEVAQLGIPTVFIPSPNVAANHQFKNAEVLKNKNACELIKDCDMNNEINETIANLINDSEKLNDLSMNIKKFAKPNAINTIANEIINMARTI
jgi:UDP-N-acetylglucosamine--N-acetylmuramyl-(pentapeptide) pyrophosphoryl-undecaprenol N-acetylglucosamine transferase